MYRQTHFTILSAYEWNKGFPNRKSADAFYEELGELFRSAGWEYKPEDGCGSDACALRGKETLFLYPREISGIVLDNSVPEIESLLAHATTFRHIRTYGRTEYVEMSDEAYLAYLESRRGEIEAAILERFKTKRGNLYLTGEQAEIIARPFKVYRLESLKAYQPDLSVLYVRKLADAMIADGRLAVAETRSGKGVRAAGALKRPRTKSGVKTR